MTIIYLLLVVLLSTVAIKQGWAQTGDTAQTGQTETTGRSADLYVTAKNTGERLTKKADAAFEHQGNIPVTIAIDPAVNYQTIVGFGGAFTDAAAYALSRISPEKRSEVIKAYFDPVKGLGYSLCRTHINSCDFSRENYSYAEVPGDIDLKNFSVARDQELLIPLIKEAINMAGDYFKIFASPWSPPAWMKTNGRMNWGGKLKPEYADVWAKYFAKYIKAYADQGIDIWGITVQNEPGAVQRWDSCIYTAAEERDFVKNNLGPMLASENLHDVKIIVWDHNKNVVAKRAEGVLSDPNAAKYVWGVGYHWYRGEHFDQLAEINNKYPDKKLLFTEGCIMYGPRIGAWYTGEKYGRNIIGDLNHFSVGWVDWNIVLDERGGPNHARNYCDAPVIADGKNNKVIYQSSFYYLGHFSKFIRPGAVRIGCTINNPRLEATAFLNTDGRIAVVVMNPTNRSIGYTLGQACEITRLKSPAHSIQTLVYENFSPSFAAGK